MRIASSAVMAFLLSTSPAVAQQAFCCPEPCPNQGRTKIEKAGKSNVTEINCAQIVLSILGSTFTSPPKCVDSFVHRDADEFQCGAAQPAPGYCCDARDHKVTLKIYGPTNTCPTVPATLPTTVAEAFAAVQCQTPKLTRTTFNWSAGLVKCETKAVGTLGEPAHEEISGASAYDYVAWHKSPDELLGEPDRTLFEGWHAEFETVPPAALPSPMREAYLLSPSIPAVEGVVAKVTIAYPDIDVSHDFKVSGTIAADGRFALEEVGIYEHPEGDRKIAVDLSYDHMAFYVGQQGASFYSAYVNTRADTIVNLETLGATALPLVDWVRSPFAVSLSPIMQRATSFATVEVEGEQMEVLQVTETMPDSGLEGTRIYDLQMTQNRMLPRRLTVLDASGQLVTRKLFNDYEEFEPDHFRPMQVVVERFAPGASEPSEVVSVQISEARRVAIDDVKSWRKGSSLNKWYVFQ